ncbi:MAG: NfeD family protein [Bacteroidales bacterium]
MKSIVLSIIALLISITSVEALSSSGRYYVIDLKREIGSTTWLYVDNGIREADAMDVDAIFIHMNTYGGSVEFADSIRTRVLNSKKPVYCFIDNNAASAGALIAIACDSIYMRSGGSIGAATVVDNSGKVLPDKYQSYMRSTIRSTAESQGKVFRKINGMDSLVWRRDPLIAEAMVDASIVAPSNDDSTRVLSLTVDEAIELNYCEAKVESINRIIEDRLLVASYEVFYYKPSLYDKIKGFLMNPMFQAILIMFIIGGLYFELQTPGIGFALIVSVLSSILYFSPLYIDGLAANWEIVLFLLGIILLFLELFVIPGFGIAGVMGILLIVVSLILALLSNDVFDFELVSDVDYIRALLIVLFAFLIGGFGAIFLASRIGLSGPFKRIALENSQQVSRGYIAVDLELVNLVGKSGVVQSALRPSGKIIIDGNLFESVAIYGFIESGKKVRVVRFENSQLYVVEDKKI